MQKFLWVRKDPDVAQPGFKQCIVREGALSIKLFRRSLYHFLLTVGEIDTASFFVKYSWCAKSTPWSNSMDRVFGISKFGNPYFGRYHTFVRYFSRGSSGIELCICQCLYTDVFALHRQFCISSSGSCEWPVSFFWIPCLFFLFVSSKCVRCTRVLVRMFDWLCNGKWGDFFFF